MNRTPDEDEPDPQTLPPLARELLRDPAFREAFLEILSISNRTTPAGADPASTKEKLADACERFLHALVMTTLPQLTEELPPDERPAVEERLRNLAANWRRSVT